MPAISKQVRSAVKTLMDAIPDVAVYANMVYPKATLPCINVSTPSETPNEETPVMGDCDSRTVTVMIEVTDKAVTGVDDNLDDLAVLVEAQIDADDTLGGLVQFIEYQETTTETSGDAEKPVGVATLTYTAST